MNAQLLLTAAVAMAISAAAQEREDQLVQPVPSVDLVRYAGTWFEIARFPNRFQEKCTGDVTASYTVLEDGTIQVVNRCRKEDGTFDEAEGKARRKSEEEPSSKLEVRFAPAFLSFLPFVWADYWVIDLAPDYSYAVVSGPSREYLWILSRSPIMEQARYDEILDRLRVQSFDVSRLVKTKQSAGEGIEPGESK